MTTDFLSKEPVRMVPHDPAWKQRFLEEKMRLQAAIGAYVLDIQHIGSTAVPGIVAKPIIDIGAAVENFEAANVCVAPLTALGYEYHGENGIPRRHFFVFGTPRSIHLHMFERSSAEWQNHLLFRDYLRSHPQQAAAYSALKIELAARLGHDRASYTDAKAPFISRVIVLAREEQLSANG